MKQANIIDFFAYREQHKTNALLPDGGYTEDLVTAIQLLIQRLRESDPIKQANDVIYY